MCVRMHVTQCDSLCVGVGACIDVCVCVCVRLNVCMRASVVFPRVCEASMLENVYFCMCITRTLIPLCT